eukprot:TRINITY_DN382_c0_g1_i1.p1 TRINITY_DN382_c0_g1~~TRINITY_DN382_c0_g1_i1.p1  ORF type:complete len:514 (+),score=85.59 TRINITY_DN382_c0_g1_i1:2579-4120(+)
MLSRVKGIARVLGQAFRQAQSAPIYRSILTASRVSVLSRPTFTPFTLFRGFASDLPSHKVLDMPNLSPTMTKGTITKWYKKEGESFSAGDVLCDVETDKATVGFEMVDSGVLAKILVPGGTKDVPLGAPVAVVVDEEKDVPAFKDFKAPERATAKKPEPPKEPEKKEAPKPEPKPEPKEVKPEAKPEPKPKKEEKLPPQDQYPASPAARKIAADNNIDLGKIKATGKGGRVTKGDVLEYLAGGARAEKPKVIKEAGPAIPGMPAFQDINLSDPQNAIAARVAEAKKTVPHFYVSIECEVDKLLEVRDFLNKYSKSKVSINDILVKAAAITCTKVKDSNSAWMNTFIRQYKDVDVSVAVQTPQGLFYPSVARANLKGLEKIAAETKVLKEKGKAGQLKADECVGGTFTVSNPGMHGIVQLIEAVNAPQACTLGVGKVEKKVELDSKKETTDKPWKIVNRMTVTLSCDHRVVDGAVASEWTKEFKKVIENPLLMMLQMHTTVIDRLYMCICIVIE